MFAVTSTSHISSSLRISIYVPFAVHSITDYGRVKGTFEEFGSLTVPRVAKGPPCFEPPVSTDTSLRAPNSRVYLVLHSHNSLKTKIRERSTRKSLKQTCKTLVVHRLEGTKRFPLAITTSEERQHIRLRKPTHYLHINRGTSP